MKKTSLSLIGLVAAGAIAVAVTAAVTTCANNGRETAKLLLDGELCEKQLPEFSQIVFTTNGSIIDNTPGVYMNLSYPLTVIQEDEISSPYIKADLEWYKYMTVSADSGILTVNMDFHGMEALIKKMKAERRNLLFNGGPITIYVPEAMLTSVDANQSAVTCLEHIKADALDITLGNVLFYNCNIDSLRMTTRSDGEMSTAFTDCTIDNIVLESYRTDEVTVDGSGNTINNFVWLDGYPNMNENAYMKLNTTGIKNFEWKPECNARNIIFNRKGSITSSTLKAEPDTVPFVSELKINYPENNFTGRATCGADDASNN